MGGRPRPDAGSGQEPDTALGAAMHNLLVIDDAVIHRTLISRIAEQIGFVALTAGSYAEAAKLLQEHKFDCITLDLGLGEHDGVEILHLLAEIGSSMPVIIISGAEKGVYEEAVKVGKSLNLDIRATFPKPIDLKVMRIQLERIKLKSSLQKGAPASM